MSGHRYHLFEVSVHFLFLTCLLVLGVRFRLVQSGSGLVREWLRAVSVFGFRHFDSLA